MIRCLLGGDFQIPSHFARYKSSNRVISRVTRQTADCRPPVPIATSPRKDCHKRKDWHKRAQMATPLYCDRRLLRQFHQRINQTLSPIPDIKVLTCILQRPHYTFSKALTAVASCGKCTRTLTFENARQSARALSVSLSPSVSVSVSLSLSLKCCRKCDHTNDRLLELQDIDKRHGE